MVRLAPSYPLFDRQIHVFPSLFSGYCRIIDLNIAQICDDKNCKVANEAKSTFGTLPYIGITLTFLSSPLKLHSKFISFSAPELLRGQEHNHKVDWWSLGIMAFFMASGRVPFSPKGDASIALLSLISLFLRLMLI